MVQWQYHCLTQSIGYHYLQSNDTTFTSIRRMVQILILRTLAVFAMFLMRTIYLIPTSSAVSDEARRLDEVTNADDHRWNEGTVADNVDSIINCSMDDSGFFGIENGRSTTFSLPYYTVEIASTSEKPIKEIMDEVKEGFADIILSTLFQSSCLPISTLPLSKRILLRRRLVDTNSIIGLSTMPPDAIIEAAECSISYPENHCFVVSSKFTVYPIADLEENTLKLIASTTKKAIIIAIANGYFNNNDDIIKLDIIDSIVTKYESDAVTFPTVLGDERKREITLINGILLFGAILTGSIALILMVIGSMLLAKGRKQKQQSLSIDEDGDIFDSFSGRQNRRAGASNRIETNNCTLITVKDSTAIRRDVEITEIKVISAYINDSNNIVGDYEVSNEDYDYRSSNDSGSNVSADTKFWDCRQSSASSDDELNSQNCTSQSFIEKSV